MKNNEKGVNYTPQLPDELEYNVKYVAAKWGMSPEDILVIIESVGNDLFKIEDFIRNNQ